jgi:hypothetical protein
MKFTVAITHPELVFFARKNTIANLIYMLIGLVLFVVVGFFWWQHYFPVTPSDGWTYEVVQNDIPKASALGMDGNGNLLVTEELLKGKGRLLSIAPDGQRTILAEGLSKPDGMAPFDGGFAFSQEGGTFPVKYFQHGEVEDLFDGNSVEGLVAKGDYLYAIEDRKRAGRLLRYDARSRTVTTLRTGLDESEAVAICPDGRIFYTEKTKHLIRILSSTGQDPVFNRSLINPSALFCNGAGLWVSEDRTHLARLLLLDMKGDAQVILSHLRAPQSILPVSESKFLLAEGGRNRILEISRVHQ